MDGAETAPALTWQMRAPIMRPRMARHARPSSHWQHCTSRARSRARMVGGTCLCWWCRPWPMSCQVAGSQWHACVGSCRECSAAGSQRWIYLHGASLRSSGAASLQDPTYLCRSVDGQAGGAGHWHREEAQPVETVSMSLLQHLGITMSPQAHKTQHATALTGCA